MCGNHHTPGFCTVQNTVHTGTQSFRSIFVPVSGTQKETVHTGTERLRIGFCFCSHGNAIVPFHSFLFSPCHFFQQQIHPRMRLRQKSYRSVFWTSLSPHCLFTRERNRTNAYRSTFRITYFIVPLFGTERCYFKRSRVNAAPERSTFRNVTIAFPCERGLNSTLSVYDCATRKSTSQRKRHESIKSVGQMKACSHLLFFLRPKVAY